MRNNIQFKKMKKMKNCPMNNKICKMNSIMKSRSQNKRFSFKMKVKKLLKIIEIYNKKKKDKYKAYSSNYNKKRQKYLVAKKI